MTYVVMASVILAVIVAASWPVPRRVGFSAVGWTLVVLIALTLVFDNMIVGFGIVGYDDALISGIRVPFAPIEDFSYAIAAAFMVPAVWIVLGSRKQ